jgi:hypothetical protein
MQLLAFHIKCAADAQYLANMQFNVLNNIFGHVEIMAQYSEDGEVLV